MTHRTHSRDPRAHYHHEGVYTMAHTLPWTDPRSEWMADTVEVSVDTPQVPRRKSTHARRARFSEADKQAIREEYRNGNATCAEIGLRYGVSYSMVVRIGRAA